MLVLVLMLVWLRHGALGLPLQRDSGLASQLKALVSLLVVVLVSLLVVVLVIVLVLVWGWAVLAWQRHQALDSPLQRDLRLASQLKALVWARWSQSVRVWPWVASSV